MADATKSGPLARLWVGISGAVPDQEQQACSELLLHSTLARLVERILTAGGNIVYGSHPTFTDVIDGVAEGLFAKEPQPGRIRMYVGRRFFSPQPNTKEPAPVLTEEQYAALHRPFAQLVWVGPPFGDRQAVLDDLREVFICDADALVCIGGKGPRAGITPGVGQEAEIAVRKKKPVFLMAWAGGYTRNLYQDWTQERGFSSNLQNSLSRDENEMLADPARASDSVDLVLDGLLRIHKA